MKRNTAGHPKLKALARRLRVPLPMAVGLLELLWHFTAEYAPAGDVGRFNDGHIAEAVGWPAKRLPGELIEALTELRWLDTDPQYRLVVHDWPEHCDDTVHRRLARGGHRFATGALPNFSRLNRREREQAESLFNSTDCNGNVRTIGARDAHDVRTSCASLAKPIEPSHSRAHAVRTSGDGFDFESHFEELWKTYPQKGRTKKPDAQRQYLEKLDHATDPESLHGEIVAAVTGKWARSQTWAKGFIPGLGEFLRNERWCEDPEPAEIGAEIDYPTVAELEEQTADAS